MALRDLLRGWTFSWGLWRAKDRESSPGLLGSYLGGRDLSGQMLLNGLEDGYLRGPGI